MYLQKIPFCLFLVMLSLASQSCDPDEKKGPVVYKPNIYIYPEQKVRLEVLLGFPMGGEIISSIPDYGNGWSITVDESGTIDDAYSFLFYESSQPDIWQRTDGWTVRQQELESFFRQNMLDYGFYGQEIDDFIEYWVPRLNDHEYYSIYPQTMELINDVIELYFSIEPENSLRLFYVIQGQNSMPGELPLPEITSFNRDGFFVTEWGVIL